MYYKDNILSQIASLGIDPNGTVFIHSSMKPIGLCENGAHTVLDAWVEYMDNGLLVLPTHTWKSSNNPRDIYDPLTEPSCVGVLSNVFLTYRNVFRSWHPTHSVAAIGRDAREFVSREEQVDTPCARHGCYGKLVDRRAQIVFIGCSLKKNTLLHGVEEWNGIPNRLSPHRKKFLIQTPDGQFIERPMHVHQWEGGDISEHYDKVEGMLRATGILQTGQIGDAKTLVIDAFSTCSLVSELLIKEPGLFENGDALF